MWVPVYFDVYRRYHHVNRLVTLVWEPLPTLEIDTCVAAQFCVAHIGTSVICVSDYDLMLLFSKLQGSITAWI